MSWTDLTPEEQADLLRDRATRNRARREFVRAGLLWRHDDEAVRHGYRYVRRISPLHNQRGSFWIRGRTLEEVTDEARLVALGAKVPAYQVAVLPEHLEPEDERALAVLLTLTGGQHGTRRQVVHNDDERAALVRRGREVFAALPRLVRPALDADVVTAAGRDVLLGALGRQLDAEGLGGIPWRAWYSGTSPSVHLELDAWVPATATVANDLGVLFGRVARAAGLAAAKGAKNYNDLGGAGAYHPPNHPGALLDLAGRFGAGPAAEPRVLRARGGLYKDGVTLKRPAPDVDARHPRLCASGPGALTAEVGAALLVQRAAEAGAAHRATLAARQPAQRPRARREEVPLEALPGVDLAHAAEIVRGWRSVGGNHDKRLALAGVLVELGGPSFARRHVALVAQLANSAEGVADAAACVDSTIERAEHGLRYRAFGALRDFVGAAEVARLAVALGRDTGRATLHLGRRLLGRARADRDRALARRARAQADAAAAVYGRDSDGYRHAIAVAVCGAAEQAVSYVNDWHDDEAPQERGAWLERCKRIACPACWGYFVEAAASVFRATLEAHERTADPLGWSLAQLRFRSLEDAHHARERLVAAVTSSWLAWAVTYDGAGGALLTIWCDRPTMAGTLARSTVADRAHYRYLAYRPEVVFVADDVTIPRLADHVAGALYVHHGVARDALLREGVERWAEVAGELKKGHTVGHAAAFSWPTRDAVATDAKDRVDPLEDPPEGYSRRYTLRRAADGRHLADSEHPLTIQDAARHLRRVASEVETPWDDPAAAGAFADDAQRALDRLRAHLGLTTGPPG